MHATPCQALSVVVPSYNGREVLRACLALLGLVAPNAEVVVVDGNSQDGSAEMVEATFPDAKLLRVPNHGWAHANNQGFEIATRPYLLTINADVFLTQAALHAMLATLEANPRVALVGPTVRNGDGSAQWVFGVLYWPNWWPVRQASRVHLLHGCCLMLRRETLEAVGGFDEHFFFYNEEFDYCWRLQKAKLEMRLVPEHVVHLGSPKSNDPRFQLEGARGVLYLMHKHHPGFVANATRRGMQLLAFLARHWPQPQTQRDAWAAFERIAKEARHLDSPFALSGRGEVRFLPKQQPQERSQEKPHEKTNERPQQ